MWSFHSGGRFAVGVCQPGSLLGFYEVINQPISHMRVGCGVGNLDDKCVHVFGVLLLLLPLFPPGLFLLLWRERFFFSPILLGIIEGWKRCVFCFVVVAGVTSSSPWMVSL